MKSKLKPIQFTYTLENGEEVTVEIPSVKEICSRCDGEGVHDNPAFSNGISGEEWERDWDYEEREMYMSGAFDVRCDECDGNKIVMAPDWKADWGKTEDGRDLMGLYEKHLDDEQYYRMEQEAERRMGA